MAQTTSTSPGTPASPSAASPSAADGTAPPTRRTVILLQQRLSWLLAFGTQAYPPSVARRLRILNGMAWLIVVTSLNYAITFGMADFERYHPFVWLNLALAVMGLCVPFMHRIHELAGGLLVATTEIAAVFLFTAMLGRESGTQINLLIGAAAPFFIFGLHRPWLIALVILIALGAHLAGWFLFPSAKAWIGADAHLLDQLYVSSAITAFIIISAIVYYAYSLAERAEQATDALLRNTLPGSVVDRLQANPELAVSDVFENVSILFTDLAGFVSISKKLGPQDTVALLNSLVSTFDTLASRHGIEKIKTIGDSYMAAAGLPLPCPDHADRILRFALAIRAAVHQTAREFDIDLPMRIGVACGPVMAGIIGTQKMTYDVWGDAVNLAARLESSGLPDAIRVSDTIRSLTLDRFCFSNQQLIDVKGFGPVAIWDLAGSNHE
jgi:adenylate cyclase